VLTTRASVLTMLLLPSRIISNGWIIASVPERLGEAPVDDGVAHQQRVKLALSEGLCGAVASGGMAFAALRTPGRAPRVSFRHLATRISGVLLARRGRKAPAELVRVQHVGLAEPTTAIVEYARDLFTAIR
jgi:hypothetical protein